jgi:hypothetical protein
VLDEPWSALDARAAAALDLRLQAEAVLGVALAAGVAWAVERRR